jgi:hypothetical protein
LANIMTSFVRASVCGPVRQWAVAVLLASFIAASVWAALPAAGATAPTTYVVATDGSDQAAGSVTAPFRTIAKGLAVLQPGDTLLVRDGTYREEIKRLVRQGRPDARITLAAYPGESPVLQGLLWLTRPSYWTIDGLTVTWQDGTSPGAHMVKIIDGVGWQVLNSEFRNAQSYANLLIYGTGQHPGEPGSWRLANSCLHSTRPANRRNQDHNVYVNTGPQAGAGLIERNLFFDAPNGMNVKLGGSKPDLGAAANVTVRDNTMVGAAQNVMVLWQSRNNVIERNVIATAEGNYGNVRSYQLDNDTNVARNNVGFDAASFFLHYDSIGRVQDGGGNLFGRNPRFDAVGTCDGYRPTDSVVAAYGHLSAAATPPAAPPPTPPSTSPAPSPAPSPTPSPTTSPAPGPETPPAQEPPALPVAGEDETVVSSRVIAR